MNMAARLQEAGKSLDISVLIGPGAAALTTHPLGSATEIELRSFGRVRVSTLRD